MAEEDREFQQGERIAGTNYVVIQRETAGGHGSLYRVRHFKLTSRIFALKFLHADLRTNSDLALRMEQEAQILASMNHPHIVPIYDAGTTSEVDPDTRQSIARPFLTMEWLKGRSLARILADVHGVGIGLKDTLEIGIEVADALDYAHTHHGVIHRDIKPDNVFLQAAPSAHGKTVTRLLDFGVAAVLGIDKADNITQKPAFLGTPRHAAPEQLRGETPTPQTDLYALGLMLYEMLVGYGPYDELVGHSRGHNAFANMARAHLLGQPAPLPERDFPQAIVELVMGCLAKLPAGGPAARSTSATACARSSSRPRSGAPNAGRSVQDRSHPRADGHHAGWRRGHRSRASAWPFRARAPQSGRHLTRRPAGPAWHRRERRHPARQLARRFGSLRTPSTRPRSTPRRLGAQPPTTTARHNPQMVIDTAIPTHSRLVDRLAVTKTTPPLRLPFLRPDGPHGTQSYAHPCRRRRPSSTEPLSAPWAIATSST